MRAIEGAGGCAVADGEVGAGVARRDTGEQVVRDLVVDAGGNAGGIWLDRLALPFDASPLSEAYWPKPDAQTRPRLAIAPS